MLDDLGIEYHRTGYKGIQLLKSIRGLGVEVKVGSGVTVGVQELMSLAEPSALADRPHLSPLHHISNEFTLEQESKE